MPGVSLVREAFVLLRCVFPIGMIGDSVGAGDSRGVGDCLALMGFFELGQFFVGGVHADGFQTRQANRLKVAIFEASVWKKWS